MGAVSHLRLKAARKPQKSSILARKIEVGDLRFYEEILKDIDRCINNLSGSLSHLQEIKNANISTESYLEQMTQDELAECQIYMDFLTEHGVAWLGSLNKQRAYILKLMR